MTTSTFQNGNVLFYILLCIVLFAALGYAFSQGRTGGSNISDQKAQLYAAEIINYGNQLRSAMSKLKLRGCAESKYNFANSEYKTVANAAINSSNSNAPADKSCDLFEAQNGGSIVPYVVPEEALIKASSTGWTRGHGGVRIRQVTGSGTNGSAGTTSANDIIFTLSFIDTNVCRKINDLLNIQNDGSIPPAPTQTGTAGQYNSGSLSGNAVISNPGGLGAKAFCFSNPPENIFLQVLLER